MCHCKIFWSFSYWSHERVARCVCYIYHHAMLSSYDIFIASQYLFDMYRCFIVLQCERAPQFRLYAPLLLQNITWEKCNLSSPWNGQNLPARFNGKRGKLFLPYWFYYRWKVIINRQIRGFETMEMLYLLNVSSGQNVCFCVFIDVSHDMQHVYNSRHWCEGNTVNISLTSGSVSEVCHEFCAHFFP